MAEVEAKDPEGNAENSGDQETAPTSGVEAKILNQKCRKFRRSRLLLLLS